MCGEKGFQLVCRRVRLGSPPRVRGKVDDPETGDLIHRITPACAGKSLKQIYKIRHNGDHPRVCGEKL